ncbi:MAG: hypothetical protein QNJ34_16300 [Xenococcaceae cyanobacterium MO_188.B29]|nr:hypothetical protein [Xenococcaceae cyanobacterium MO_188.B29]
MKTNLLKKRLGVNSLLKLVAIVALVSLFFKAIIDVDKSYDTWFYHVPFAARIWGIIPAELHTFYDTEEYRFVGFPLLVEFLQGFFWFITQHLQAGNLVCFFSLILYCYFLKAYFKVSIYYSAIALLAIPLVQIHTTSFYVDLPGNLCLSTLIMLTYLLYIKQGIEVYNRRNLLLIFFSAVAAANIKFQLVPLVFLLLCFVVARIIWLRCQQIQTRTKLYRWLLTFIPTIFFASLLIFATPIKNVALYGNPFYPIRIEIAGQVLNHQLGFYQHAADSIKDAPQAQRWLYSILEINSPQWSIDQWSPNPNKSRLGGFFGGYVLFNLILLGYLFIRHRCHQTSTAIILLAVMSTITAFAPQSHELRYYLYWMITLVSLNLYLVTYLEKSSSQRTQLLNPLNLGFICLVFLAVVITKTNFVYIKPNFYTLDKHLQYVVNPKILKQIQPGEKVCLINKSKQYRKTNGYPVYFHPQLNYSYSIKSALDSSECRGLRQINVP